MDAEKTSSPLWHEGTVDANGEHLLLTYGEGVPDNDLPVALVALGPKLTITVQFLIAATGGDERAGNILSELRQELDTCLAGENALVAWDEGKYHCTISPNLDSKIHWCYSFSLGKRTALLPQDGTRPDFRPNSAKAEKITSISLTEQL